MNYLLQDGFGEAYREWRRHNTILAQVGKPIRCSCLKQGVVVQTRPPLFNGCQLRLEDLWKSVQCLGGSRRVSEGRRWATIGRMFNPPPTMTNFSYRIKQLYAEYLLEFERVRLCLPSSPCLKEICDATEHRSRKGNACPNVHGARTSGVSEQTTDY